MSSSKKSSSLDPSAIIYTEGKTDWQLLKKSHKKLNLDLNISFFEFEDKDVGDINLLKKCEIWAESPHQYPQIFIFDNDNKEIVKKTSNVKHKYKNWGNNVFSFVLPIPSHRIGFENICIEFYFTDSELKIKDLNGRRLFLTSEFKENSGNLKDDSTVHIGHKGKLKGLSEPRYAKVVDSEVYDSSDKSIALSKANFAEYVCEEIKPFDNLNFGEFQKIFEIIQLIIQENLPKVSLYSPHFNYLFDVQKKEKAIAEQFLYFFEGYYNLLEMTMQLFIACTIRYYEDTIIEKPTKYEKQVKFIKKEIKNSFKEPTFATLHRLTSYCFHAIDINAPQILHEMREYLSKEITLGSIGNIFEDLEKIFPPDQKKPKIINKSRSKKQLLGYIIPEFAKYKNKIDKLREILESDQFDLESGFNIDNWREAMVELFGALRPIISNKYRLRSLRKIDRNNENYIVTVKKYDNEKVELSEETIDFEEFEKFQEHSAEIMTTFRESQLSISLFPFIIIKDDKLYFYRRTRAFGYEYFSIIDDSVSKFQTKKKFNHSVFITDTKAGQQALFWTEVLPSYNQVGNIKANIPLQGLVDFVGRRKQLDILLDEIIEIPNQNGFIHGLGGVGKTALLLQLTKELFEEKQSEKVNYNNIIWVSAKTNYYDYSFNAVEPKKQQFESLDNILTFILHFFDYEDIEEYDLEEKKDFVLELLEDNKVLLILDNFETIADISITEAEKIIRFFQIDVKSRLKRKPEFFKVIVTSRKHIPSGFHQIKLVGLDWTESRALMTNLFKNYKNSKQELSVEQKSEIYKVTHGIPIVIKHCFGQMFEFNRPFNDVIHNLSNMKNKVIEFSFAEILKLLKKDETHLKILILLEVIYCPLMIRQIADILNIEEYEIEQKIPDLMDFQCIERFSDEIEEKYTINEKVSLLTKSLVQECSDIAKTIRQEITKNFTIDKQMDYTTEELLTLNIFDKYLADKDDYDAEHFIKDALEKKPESILLRFHYAKYLKERKYDILGAIKILLDLGQPDINHPNILKLLVSSYLSLESPPFDDASIYVNKLKDIIPKGDNEAILDIARFYVKWSLSIKLKRELDPLKEITRQGRYKSLAENALTILDEIKIKTHKVYHLYAQSYFNMWKYEEALDMIGKAIEIIGENPSYLPTYTYLRKLIIKNMNRYS